MAKHVLFEIGLEELPARFIDQAEQQLYERTKEWLRSNRLEYDQLFTYSTPRRLTVIIQSIAQHQTTISEDVRGPAKKIAQDEDGNWTKAALGFTKGQGKTVDDIYVKDVKGTPYIFVTKQTEGLPSIDILPSFKDIITSIDFPQKMRWGTESLTFARPIRWLVALYDQQIIPFEIAHIKTSNETYGHRFLSQKVMIQHPLDYVQLLEDNFVIASKGKREQIIVEGIKEIEEEKDIYIPVDDDLLREVCHLVEYPTVFVGTFEKSFLSLPKEVLMTSMKEHQRYFPVTNKEGDLLPYFIGVRNGNTNHLDTVIRGNEKVLHARLADAVFFYEEDQKQSISDYLNTLKRVVFQEKLGTIDEKVKRIKNLAKHLTERLACDGDTKTHVLRAAEICKFDLPTQMVNEFPELQGVMGEKYAIIFGEHNQVAQAIREHYLPAHAQDETPSSLIGAIVSIADKIDTIVGCIAIDLIPTGSRDPYGLRRQAAGVLRILSDMKWNITLESLIDVALEQYVDQQIIDHVTNDMTRNMFNFFKLRTTYLLRDQHIEQDVIEAVFHQDIGAFPYMVEKVHLLSKRRSDSSYKSIQEELMRVLNMASSTEPIKDNIDPSLFQTESERQLYEKLNDINVHVQEAHQTLNAAKELEYIETLAVPIHSFFENNMVMDKNETIKNNRITLVHKIAEIILNYADLTKIEWRQHF